MAEHSKPLRVTKSKSRQFKDTATTILACVVGISIGIVASVLMALVLQTFDAKTNAIGDSRLWGGYSPIEVYQIYDGETGIYYAVTESGGIEVMLNKDGKPKMVDGGEAI